MKRYDLLLLLVLLPFLVQCAAQDDIRTLDLRLRSLDSEVVKLKEQNLSQLGSGGSVENVAKRQAEVGSSLDKLNSELLRLNGRIDEIQHAQQESTKSKAQMDKLTKEVTMLSERVAVMEGQLSGVMQNRLQDATQRAETAAKEAEKAEAEKANLSGPVSLTPTPGKIKPGEETSQESTRAQALYEGALALYRTGRYKEAKESFTEFIDKNPQDKLVPNARFWLGDCLYNLRELEAAVLEYQKVVTDFPTHDKASAALLKQGIAFEELKDPDTARIIYKKLLADYPKSEQVETAKKHLAQLP